MYNNYLRPVNPYAQRLNAMEQQSAYQQPQGMPTQPMYQPMTQPQPIQNLSQIQPQVVCYLVGTSEDMGKIDVMPNTIYVGLNTKNQEIYTRKITNDGLLEIETYSRASGTKEKGDLQAIQDKLEEIEKKISNIPTQRPTLALKGGNEDGGQRITKDSSK